MRLELKKSQKHEHVEREKLLGETKTDSHKAYGYYVAIKEFEMNITKTVEVLNEAKIHSLVKHDNVLDFIGICMETDNRIQIITPYRSQGSLERFLRSEMFVKACQEKQFGWLQLHFCLQIAEVHNLPAKHF